MPTIKVSGYTKSLLDGIIQEHQPYPRVGEYKTYDDIIGYICTYYILETDRKSKKK